MAFECPHCGARNNEVQMGGLIPDKGVRFELRVERGDTKVGETSAAATLCSTLCAPPHTSWGRLCCLHVLSSAQSLSRQVVKGDTCTAKARAGSFFCGRCFLPTRLTHSPALQIPELDFEIPCNTQRGTMTTVRLRYAAPARRQTD